MSINQAGDPIDEYHLQKLYYCSILIFFKKSSCMYIPIPRSTFWQNCIFGLLVDISSLSLPQILGFFSFSVLLTRLILTSRNSYCLVHHLDSITRLLIILIVREKKEWERESACHYSFLRLLSLQIVFNSDNLYNSMDHIPRSILMTMLTQGLTRGGIMNCGIYRI